MRQKQSVWQVLAQRGSRSRPTRALRRFFCLWVLSLSLCLGLGYYLDRPVAWGQPPQHVYKDVSQAVEQGVIAFEQGDYHGAIDHWQAAWSKYQRQADSLNQAVVGINLTQAYTQLGDWGAARDAIATTVDRLAASPTIPERQRLQGQVLNTKGSLLMAQGQLEQALKTWEQATAIYEQLQEPNGQIRTQLNQAQALQALGYFRRARRLLTTITTTLETQPMSDLKSASYRQLGTIAELMGDFEFAHQALNQSYALGTAMRSQPEMSITLLSQGALAEAQGDVTAAVSLYQKAEHTAVDALTQFQAMVNQLRLLIGADRWTQAQTTNTRIETLVDNVAPHQAGLLAQLSWHKTLIDAESMRLQTEQPDVPQLISMPRLAKQLATLVQTAQQLRDPRTESHALGMLAHLYEKTQQYDDALTLTQQALQLSEAINANEITYQWQWQLGRLHQQLVTPSQPVTAQKHRQAAISAYGNTITTLGKVRQALLSIRTDRQFDFRDNVEPVYRQYVDLLLSPETNPNPEQLEDALTTMDALRIAELENFLLCNLAPQQSPPPSLSQLDPTAVFIYPVLLDHRLELLYQLPDSPLQHQAVPVERNTVANEVETLHKKLSESRATDDVQVAAHQLYQWLIDPIRPQLDSLPSSPTPPTLVFVLEPTLQKIPMGVLYDQGHYLIEDYAVSILPSRQLLDLSPRSRRLRVLTAGISEAQNVEGQAFSALPYVKDELNKINEISGSQRTLLNQGFTENRLQTDLNVKQMPVLHIATHGQFSTDPNQTFLLAWGQKLKLHRLDQLLQSQNVSPRSRIELLVLSACETAKGHPRAALGLAGAAVQSRVRSTIATLWQVNDRSTSDLMQAFYEYLHQGDSISEALRKAQLSLMTKHHETRPHFWAPFILVGNWT